MAVRHRHWPVSLMALLLVVGMMTGFSACSTGTGSTTTSDGTARPSSHGHVAIFVPSDGLTISQQTPLSKWAKLVPELTKALQKQGIEPRNITAKTSGSLDDQSRDIQDYVVDNIASAGGDHPQSSAAEPEKTPGAPNPSTNASEHAGANGGTTTTGASDTTLIVAPLTTVQSATRQYGDYVSHALTWDAGESSPTSRSPSSPSPSSTSPSSSTTDDQGDADSADAGQRLVSALSLAKESGAHVIVLSNAIQGFQPDAFVQMSTARQIGAMQARQMVSKLALDKATAANPKSIEILLPYDTKHDGDAIFAEESFVGIWTILGPYVRSGKVISPSGKLTPTTTSKDWRDFICDADTPDDVKGVLDKRLDMSDKKKTHTRVDGIIAMNDYVASGVVAELESLQYTGTSADVNPTISVSGIVNNITGKKDLVKSTVPKPARRPESSTADGDTDATEEEVNARWPIITGYGSYIGSLPQIVNGKQWMTGTEDRTTSTTDIARLCAGLNSGKTARSLSFVTMQSIDGVQTASVIIQPLAISASNLKSTLIDPGYITLADAGL